jgi:hypothetical protein
MLTRPQIAVFFNFLGLLHVNNFFEARCAPQNVNTEQIGSAGLQAANQKVFPDFFACQLALPFYNFQFERC